MSYDKFVNYLHDLNVKMNGGKEVKDWTVREHIGDRRHESPPTRPYFFITGRLKASGSPSASKL